MIKIKKMQLGGKPLDIWALGVTLYIITYLKFPFDTDKGILELYNIIKNEKVKFPDSPSYSKKLKYLIEKCLEKNPSKRKTADEILKMCTRHKYECTDKYKAIFKKRNIEIEISVEELCMTLDFFHNECNAVFENPKDKNRPLVFRFKKKLIKFEIPKGRSINKITLKQNSANFKIERPIVNRIIEQPQKTTVDNKLEIKSLVPSEPINLKKGASITIVTKKIIDKDTQNPITQERIIKIKDEDGKEINKEQLGNIMNNLGLIEEGGNIGEGKVILQKYINEK